MAPEWREIPGYPGYEASDDGRVRSVERVQPNPSPSSRGGVRVLKERVLRPAVDKRTGRVKHRLCIDGVMHSAFTHALVCAAFHGPRLEGAQTRHLNGDHTDNRAANLAWGTPRENAADTVRHVAAGKTNKSFKLKAEEVRAIRKSKDRNRDLAKQYPHVAPSLISMIRSNKIWVGI